MNDDNRTYEISFQGGGPGVEMPEGGLFQSQEQLLSYVDEVDESDFGPLAMADALIRVYEGNDVDPAEGANAVVGEIDAHVAHRKEGFDEDDLEEPFSL